MKMTINESRFKNQFRLHGCSDTFSSNGLTALYDHLEEVFDENSKYEYDLDVIGLCCDFTEFYTALEAAKDYSALITIDEDLNEEEQERQAVQFLSDRTTILQFDGGIIVQNF